ncbi:hypothetical protein TNIN_465151 [Trichonephila inaurata madagascariensis]|uniref:P/Homo B domain-containing protein n=1 Tax=Trichonephila inaurata madagascariensis TaxID=2747483 RepID=A0A8X6MDN7_9ARAC|nr:hypothetical protein TNIN_465151 [Trichonephila inaurata madagascariensis]
MKFVSPIIVCYTGNKEISASDIRHYHDLVDMNAVRVKWVALQTPLTRVKRTVFGELRLIDIYRTTFKAREKKNSREKVLEKFRNTSLINFNDPLFGEQWYLLNKGQTGSAPDNDINVLPVWKSGITGKGVRISVLDDGIHPQSEEVAQNYDSTSSEDLSFKKSNYNPIPENSHGTYCAAIAAGVANNNVCGVGVAYDAKIGGVRIIDGPVTDAQEAMALIHALEHVDIYTASWGPNDDGKSIAGPGLLAKLAFLKGISEVVPEGKGKCRKTFQGTSAAAPMAAGVIALMLQANPRLTWRDVQHIIIKTSRIPSTGESRWSVNAAGHHYHLKIGFGILDTAKMVAEALTWKFVKPLHLWTTPAITQTKFILPYKSTIIRLLVKKSFMSTQRIDSLESVSASVNIIHPRCSKLEIFLISPSGTISQILTKRPLDTDNFRIPYWEFTSLHFWGEDPNGLWTLKISNHEGEHKGMVDYFSLSLMGTEL